MNAHDWHGRHDWIQTYTGRRVFPLEPTVDQISPTDIGHALSMICRFTGHCAAFYSVAEHSCLMHDAAPEYLKLPALIHDAAEAYIADVARPIKPQLLIADIEDRLIDVIALRFGLHPDDLRLPSLKRIDTAMLATERLQVFDRILDGWDLDQERLPGVRLQFWSPETAQLQWARRLATVWHD